MSYVLRTLSVRIIQTVNEAHLVALVPRSMVREEEEMPAHQTLLKEEMEEEAAHHLIHLFEEEMEEEIVATPRQTLLHLTAQPIP